MAIDASLVFRALNVIVAVFMVAGGVATIIKGQSKILCCDRLFLISKLALFTV